MADAGEGERARSRWARFASPRIRAALLVILIVGCGVRVAWVAHAGSAPRFASDPEAYLLQGEQIARGEGYTNPLIDIENNARARAHQPTLPAQPASFYPPGYPTFVAAVTWAVWHTPVPDADLVRTIEYIQAVIGTLAMLFVFLLARRVFDARVALVAAAIVALYPNLVATTATLQFETVFITLLLGALVVLLPAATSAHRARPRLIAAGLLIGVGALVHPTILWLTLAFLAARVSMRRPWRETVSAFVVLAGASLLVVAPWTIRNEVELHAFVPVATGAGPALCQARNPEATGSIDLGILERECQPSQLSDSLAQRDVEVNRYATSHAIRWVIAHPFDEIQMWWRRTDLAYRVDTSGLFAPTLSPHGRRAATTTSNLASYVVLALAALGALLTLVRSRRPATTFLLVATAGFAAVPIALFGDPRYRVPAEPLFAILAGAAVAFVIRSSGSAPSWAVRTPRGQRAEHVTG